MKLEKLRLIFFLTPNYLKFFISISAFWVSTAFASMGNIASTYGISTLDISSSQGFSLFNPHAAVVYYNPSYLAEGEKGEITAGLVFVNGELRARGSDRSGSLLSDAKKESAVIGITFDASQLTTLDKSIYIGAIVSLEKYGTSIVELDVATSESGQFLEYDTQPIFVTLGAGMEITKGFNAGLSAILTMDVAGKLDATFLDLSGQTKYESLSLGGEPQLSFVISGTWDLEKIFCPTNKSHCTFSGWSLAGSYRQASQTDIRVDANILIQQLTPEDSPVEFSVTTLDAYQPASFTGGIQYQSNKIRYGLTLEQQQWSDLTSEFKSDTVRDQANIQFDDIIIPRIAAAYSLSPATRIVTGLAFRPTPLETTSSEDINLFDSDRIIYGLGVSTSWPSKGIFQYPLKLDLAYQYHRIDERDFVISNTKNSTENDGTLIKSDGDVHVLSGSLTLNF